MGTPVKISALTAGTTPAGTEVVPGVQSSATVKFTLDQILGYKYVAKGDLLGGSAAGTASKLTVGANGTALVADSTQTTGLNWSKWIIAGPTAARTYTFPDANLTISAIAAKGDSHWASAAGVLSTLTVGSNGAKVYADSTQTPGVKWNTTNDLTDDTSPDVAADYVESWDASAAAPKKVLLARVGGSVLLSPVVTTSGTAVQLATGLPTWVKWFVLNFLGVSTNGANTYLIQIGPSGGVENSGYNSTCNATTFTAGFGITSGSASNVVYGSLPFYLADAATNTWGCGGVVMTSFGPSSFTTSGTKPIAGALSKISITTTGGVDTFDLGSISVLYGA